MEKEPNKNFKLGLFVIAGTALLIIAMYFIGAKQNLFSNTFKIVVNFHNVDGLQAGNNVRFAGINVGTVDEVQIINDSSVQVSLMIEDQYKEYIKKNAMASIGTDGLMGNKLVNINSSHIPGAAIEEGDVIASVHPIETEEMLRTLNRTNNDVSTIARNLRIITERVNNSNTLWTILTDPAVAENVKNAIVSIRLTGERTAIISGDLSKIVTSVKNGKGTLGALITDTAISHQIKQTIVKIQLVSDTMAYISGDLKYITGKIRNGEGAVGTVLMDTTFAGNLNQSVVNLRKASNGFTETIESLKNSFLLRKYFKRKAKASKD